MTGATTLAVSGIPNSVFVEARLNQGRTEPIQQLPISMFRATSSNESAARQQSSSACFPNVSGPDEDECRGVIQQ